MTQEELLIKNAALSLKSLREVMLGLGFVKRDLDQAIIDADDRLQEVLVNAEVRKLNNQTPS